MARAESVAPATRLCACTSTLDASDSVFLSSKRSAFATCREEDTCASFQASTALRTAYFFFFSNPSLVSHVSRWRRWHLCRARRTPLRFITPCTMCSRFAVVGESDEGTSGEG